MEPIRKHTGWGSNLLQCTHFLETEIFPECLSLEFGRNHQALGKHARGFKPPIRGGRPKCQPTTKPSSPYTATP